MPLSLDFSADYLLWDFAEAVTVTSVGTAAAGGNWPLLVSHALRGQPTFKQRAPSGGAYVGADCRWLLPDALLAGRAAKAGDLIRDHQTPSVTWTVIDPGFEQLDRTWDLYCLSLSIHHRLRDRCTAWRHNPSRPAQDAAGSRLLSPEQAGDAIDCRFQLVSEAPVEGRGKRLWRSEWRVYLSEEIDGLTHEWQLRDAGGNVYQVLGVENRQRLDEVPVVTAERFGDSATES